MGKKKTAEPNINMMWVVLAAMEAYRLNRSKSDFDIRMCEAILADALGIRSREAWTAKIKEAGLIDYNGDPCKQYKALIERIESEAKCND